MMIDSLCPTGRRDGGSCRGLCHQLPMFLSCCGARGLLKHNFAPTGASLSLSLSLLSPLGYLIEKESCCNSDIVV